MAQKYTLGALACARFHFSFCKISLEHVYSELHAINLTWHKCKEANSLRLQVGKTLRALFFHQRRNKTVPLHFPYTFCALYAHFLCAIFSKHHNILIVLLVIMCTLTSLPLLSFARFGFYQDAALFGIVFVRLLVIELSMTF